MKLHYLELIGQYKGIKNQRFDFTESKSDIIALVGLNGSGKSNFLELLAEIFCFLERVKRRDFKSSKNMPFDFELYYSLTNHIEVTTGYKVEFRERSLSVYMRVVNPDPEPPRELDYDSQIREFSNRPIEFLELPEQIIGYSSGLNENLQRPFLKNITRYYDALLFRRRLMRKYQAILRAEEDFEIVERIRLDFKERYPEFFDLAKFKSPYATLIDYDSAALLVASLSVLPEEELEKFCEKIGYRTISKFSVSYNLKGKPYTGEELSAINDLLEISQPIESILNTGNILTNVEIDTALAGEDISLQETFYDQGLINIETLNNEDISFFYPLGPSSFFKKLHKVQLLGVQNWQASDKKSLRKNDFLGAIRKPLRLKLPLEITELTLLKNDGTEVNFFDLSDGEAQLIQTLAALKVFNSQTALFLFDEPDTHLNPQWRTEFHKNLDLVTNDETFQKKHQIFISTHSPFMLSSLDRKSIFHFKKEDEELFVAQPTEQTFGSSFDFLAKTFFGMNSLISSTAIDKINIILNEKEPMEAKEWIESNVGDSMEKAFLINKLSE